MKKVQNRSMSTPDRTNGACTICAENIFNNATPIQKTEWGEFLSLFGIENVNSAPAPPLPPICPICKKIVLELVTLSRKMAKCMESVEERVALSQGRFPSGDASLIKLRSQLVKSGKAREATVDQVCDLDHDYCAVTEAEDEVDVEENGLLNEPQSDTMDKTNSIRRHIFKRKLQENSSNADKPAEKRWKLTPTTSNKASTNDKDTEKSVSSSTPTLETRKYYNCTSCSKPFPSMRALKVHKSTAGPGRRGKCFGGVCPCHVCGRPVADLRIHLWTHKNAAEKKAAIAIGDFPAKHRTNLATSTFSCGGGCGKIFSFLANLKRHEPNCEKRIAMAAAQPKPKPVVAWFNCTVPDCKIRCRSQNLLDQHVLRQHTPYIWKQWICDICNYPFKFEMDLQNHKRKVHAQGEAGSKFTLQCGNIGARGQICKLKFPTEAALKFHVFKMHLKAREALGQIPEGVAIDDKQYQEMVNCSSKTESNTCKLCGKIYENPYKFKSHLQSHLSLSLEPCPVCGCPVSKIMTYTRKDHDWSHYGVMDLVTAIKAGKRLRSSMLKATNGRLRLIHVDDHGLTIKCDKCDSANDIKTAAQLQQHIDEVHRQKKTKPEWEMIIPKDVGNFKCVVCCTKHRTESALRYHGRYKHDKKKAKLWCPWCPESFWTFRPLLVHVRGNHPEQMSFYELPSLTPTIDDTTYLESLQRAHKLGKFICEFCAIEFNSLFGLMDHGARHVSEQYTEKPMIPCGICSRPFIPGSKGYEDHLWTHMGVGELVEAVNAGKIIKPDLLVPVGSRQRSGYGHPNLIHSEDHGIKIECGRCGQNDFKTVAELQLHIFSVRCTIEQSRPRQAQQQQQQPQQQRPNTVEKSVNIIDQIDLDLDKVGVPILKQVQSGSRRKSKWV